MGNQLTKDKVLEINSKEPLPYDAPEPIEPKDIDVVLDKDDSKAENDSSDDEDLKTDEGGQGLLF